MSLYDVEVPSSQEVGAAEEPKTADALWKAARFSKKWSCFLVFLVVTDAMATVERSDSKLGLAMGIGFTTMSALGAVYTGLDSIHLGQQASAREVIEAMSRQAQTESAEL